MAKKGGSKGNMGFEYHNLNPDQKSKISLISEQFPEINKDTVAIVLSHHMFDCDQAIDSLTSDGGLVAMQNFTTMQNSQAKVNNRNKKRNKKRTKKDDGTVNSTATHGTDADDSSSLHSSNVDCDGEKESTTKLEDYDVTNDQAENDPSSSNSNISNNPACNDIPATVSLAEHEACGDPLRNASPEVSKTSEDTSVTTSTTTTTITYSTTLSKSESPECDASDKTNVASSSGPREKSDDSRHQKNSSYRQRHGSYHSKTFTEEAPPANFPKRDRDLMKCKKDLSRQTSLLHRVSNQLEGKLDDASKSLKNAFNEIKRLLEERQIKLEEHLENVRKDALSLVKSRQVLGSELKIRSERNLSDQEWNDLRADIKQFVTERKYDEELGRAVWFYWSNEAITENISKFGEVIPVKNNYSQRQHSRAQNSSEPSSPHSGTLNDEGSAATANAGVEAVAGNSAEGEPKVEKDVPIKTVSQGEGRGSRVFSNSHFAQHNQSNYGGRYQQNQNPRGRGNYNRQRGGHMMNNSGPRMRNNDYMRFGGGRNNDYNRPQYNRTDGHPATQSKSAEAALNVNDVGYVVPRYMQHRDNQPHFRDNRYGGYRGAYYNNNNRGPRGGNRPTHVYSDGVSKPDEAAIDKNANYNNEMSKQVSKDSAYNGY